MNPHTIYQALLPVLGVQHFMEQTTVWPPGAYLQFREQTVNHLAEKLGLVWRKSSRGKRSAILGRMGKKGFAEKGYSSEGLKKVRYQIMQISQEQQVQRP